MNINKLVIPLLLISPALADHKDITSSQSQYTEYFDAGVLQFRGVLFDVDFDTNANKVTDLLDLNNDSIDDLILGRIHAYALSSLQPNGSISYTLYGPLGLTPSITSHAWTTAADLDNNGWPDLIHRDYNADLITIDWMDNELVTHSTTESPFNIEYTFPAFWDYAQAGIKATHADLDNDNIPDLILNTTNNAILVRWSSREPSTQYQTYPAPQLASQTALYTPRDYNGDTHPDILCLDTTSQTFILFPGTSTDALGAPITINIPIADHVLNFNYPSFGQFDADPAIDLVIYDEASSKLKLIPNFINQQAQVHTLPADPQDRVISILKDLDQSGADSILLQRPDTSVADPTAVYITSLLSDPLSPGASTTRIHAGTPPKDESSPTYIVDWTPKAIAQELDAQPDPEILWLNHAFISSNFVDLFNENRQASFRVSSPSQAQAGYGSTKITAQPDPTFALAADFDNDQIDEIFVTGTGKGRMINLPQQTNQEINQVNGALKSTVIDLGNNGSKELILSGVGQHIMVHPINPDGSLGTRTGYQNPNANRYISFHATDLNNDTLPDVLAFDVTLGELHFFQGQPDGSLLLTGITQTVPNSAPYPGLINANNDPYPDIIVAEFDTLHIYINNTDGTFSPSPSTPIQSHFPPYWIQSQDMDLDGNPDIIHASRDGRITIIYLDQNLNELTFIKLIASMTVSYRDLHIADINADNYPDILASVDSASDKYPNSQAIWVRTAPQRYNIQSLLPAPATEALALGHFNNDDNIDLVTTHIPDGSIRIHWGRPLPCPADINQDGALDFFDISTFLTNTIDFNNDGTFDFFDIAAFLTAFTAGCP